MTEELAATGSLMLAMAMAAMLYASVGHGGASAYLAVMGLAGMAQAQMKPVALVLNIAVSTVALVSFARAGHFSWRLFLPLAAASVPAAFLGGLLGSPELVFKWILAFALGVGAWRLLAAPGESDEPVRNPALPVMLATGGALGFVSGLIGIGGGIFLTPLLVLCRFARAKTAAAVSAAFIAVNSCSGLLGWLKKGDPVPQIAWALLPCVCIGGWLGARWGSGRAPIPALRRTLAAVLVVAAAKFVII
ncbi:MAG TPA: sulfite exporter TauE/SafE family protein [Luteolibacter sp.]|nr:sulfite exporter TauE/SafE family protein [Luteolibacter sp.]